MIYRKDIEYSIYIYSYFLPSAYFPTQLRDLMKEVCKMRK